MEEYEINNEKGETDDLIELKEIHIKNDGKDYCLNLKFTDEKIKLSINYNEEMISMKYVREMNLKEIKGLNKIFYYINSFYDFYDYLQKLERNNKLNIKKTDDKISLLIFSEVLLKPQTIEIDLFLTKDELVINREKIIREFKNINNKINKTIEKNKDSKYIIIMIVLSLLIILIRDICIYNLNTEIEVLKKVNINMISFINNSKSEIMKLKEENTNMTSFMYNL